MPLFISAKPILWDKVISRNSAFPFQTFYSPGLPSKIWVNPLKPNGLGFLAITETSP